MLIFNSTEAMPNSQIDYYLPNFLGKNDIVLLYGKEGSGKSLFCLSLCYSLASSFTFLNMPCNGSPSSILYVDGESSMATIQSRRRFYSHTKLHFAMGTINIFEQSESAELISFFGKETQGGVIVLDNISCLTNMDQNSQKEVIQLRDLCIKLRNMGLLVILVHHSNRSGKYFGSSALGRFPSVMLSLHKNQVAGWSAISIDKIRDSDKPFDTLRYVFDEEDMLPSIIDFTTEGKPDLRIPDAIILSLALSDIGLTQDEIITKLESEYGFKKHSIQRTLLRLLQKGELTLNEGVYTKT